MIDAPLTLNRRLVDSLYVEAMVLADEARSYFDAGGRAERDALPPMQRVGFSCEALRVTTRLMHVIAWLLTQRAVAAGEISVAQGASTERRLGAAQEHDAEMVTRLPETARAIIASASDLLCAGRKARRRNEQADADIQPRAGPDAAPGNGLLNRSG